MKILFPEGTNQKVIKASKYSYDFNLEPVLFDEDFSKKIDHSVLSKRYYELRAHKGVDLAEAKEIVKDKMIASLLLLEMGEVDAVIGGIDYTSSHVVSNAFKIIGTKNGTGTSLFVMSKNDEEFIFTDCAVIANPTPKQLCDIATLASEFSENILNKKSAVAFLSFATNGSAKSPEVDKVIEAKNLFKKGIGPIQFDAAFNKEIGMKKMGADWKQSNIFIFPTLDAGNIGYKIASHMGDYKAAGPILVGLNKVVNDLSRGASVDEIIEVIKISYKQWKIGKYE